jgi:hypothetical protein
MTRPFPRLSGLAAVALLAAAPCPVAAQRPTWDPERPSPSVRPGGSELFQAALQLAGLQPVPEYNLLNHMSVDTWRRDTVLVVIGTPANHGAFGPVLGGAVDGHQFVDPVLQSGGAVLLATDTDWQLAGQFPQSDVRISELRVRVRDPRLGHPGRARVSDDSPGTRPEHNPYLVPVGPAGGRPRMRAPLGELFDGLDRVATENPAAAVVGRYSGRYQEPLARFPNGAYFDDDTETPLNPTWTPFAVGGVGPDRNTPAAYRFLLLADQDVISNRLLADPTTHNLVLTQRIVRFLKDPDGVNRTRCVFIENGRVIDRFDAAEQYVRLNTPLPPLPPLPPLGAVLMALQDRLVEAGNRAVEDLQRRDVFNQALLGPARDPDRQSRTLQAILGGLFVAAAVWAVVFLLRRVWKTRQPADMPRPPGPVRRPDPGRPAGVFDRRERELLRRNNLYEPVRDLIRELFAQAGAPADGGRKPPPVEFEGNPRRSERLRKAIEDLWRVGYGRPVPVPVGRWQELEPQLEMVRRAFADGAWRFALAARPA